MIRAEFQRFLQTLNNGTSSEGVRKIANLVLDHLNELVPLTTRRQNCPAPYR